MQAINVAGLCSAGPALLHLARRHRPPATRLPGSSIPVPGKRVCNAGSGFLDHPRGAFYHALMANFPLAAARDCCVPPPGASEAAVPVQMELKRIIISEIHEQQVIMLKEVEGDRSFSIMIGIFEATSIDRRVKHLPSPRPLTHDLVANVIENMGGELRDVYISELRDHTYYAKLRIRLNG